MFRNLSLKLTVGGPETSGRMWWEVREQCGDLNYLNFIQHMPYSSCDHLVMYTFSDKLFPATLNFISGSG